MPSTILERKEYLCYRCVQYDKNTYAIVVQHAKQSCDDEDKMLAVVFRCLRNLSKSSPAYRVALKVALRRPAVTIKYSTSGFQNQYGHAESVTSRMHRRPLIKCGMWIVQHANFHPDKSPGPILGKRSLSCTHSQGRKPLQFGLPLTPMLTLFLSLTLHGDIKANVYPILLNGVIYRDISMHI